jgi:hypothetical protein
VLQTLLGISVAQAKRLIKRHSDVSPFIYRKGKIKRPTELELPSGVQPLLPLHEQYLRFRGFDPQQIVRTWGVQSTGFTGPYKHRIFIPVHFEWSMVSYQCLSYLSTPKYMGCEEQKEIIPHKQLVYGFDQAVEKNRCVVTEGVTDVWRLGPGAVATFGVKWTAPQVALICNHFDKVIVMFDADVPKSQASKFAQTISAHGCWSVDIVELEEGDPGELPPDKAQEIMKDLGF